MPVASLMRLSRSRMVTSAPFLKGGIHKRVTGPPSREGEENVPKLLRARAPEDAEEERKVRKLARSRHAPGDWINRARMIALSWDGLRTTQIASELRCHPQTVRERIHRFNEEGLDGLGDRPGAGRKRRITETERSLIISLVGTDPPGRLVRGAGGELEARAMRRRKLIGRWTPSPPLPESVGSLSGEARCAASCWSKG
jgi:transposase